MIYVNFQMTRMNSNELLGLLWAAQYATKICIGCNKVLGRLIGASSCSPEQIWVQCLCTGCQTREPVGFATGGNILSLAEFAQHTCSQPPSLKLFTVVQPGAPDYPVPLLEWLRIANEYMGGDALIRRQLCIFWSGFGNKNDTPNEWRSATIRRIDKATGACEIKYHDDRRKRSQAFLYLPLAIIHFARCPPPPSGSPRSVAEGHMPLPPVLPLLPLAPEPPVGPQPQSSVASVATPPSLSPSLAMLSAPAPLAQHIDTASSFPMPSLLPSTPAPTPTAGTTAALSPTAVVAAARAAKMALQLAARNQQAPSREAMAHDLPGSGARSVPQPGMCLPQPSSWPLGPPLNKSSELTHVLPSKSISMSSGLFGQGAVAVIDGMSSGTPNSPEAPAKRSWATAAADLNVSMQLGRAYGAFGMDAGLHADADRPPTKLLRAGREDAPYWHLPTGAAAAALSPSPSAAPAPASDVNAALASDSAFQLQSRASDGSGAGTASVFQPQFARGFSSSGHDYDNVPGGGIGVTTVSGSTPVVRHCHRPSSSLVHFWTPIDGSMLHPRFDTAPSVSSSSSTSTLFARAQHLPMAPLDQPAGPTTGLITVRSTEQALPPQKLATSPAEQQQQPSVKTYYPMPGADAAAVFAPADSVTAAATSAGITARVPDRTVYVTAERQNVAAAPFGCGQGQTPMGAAPMPYCRSDQKAFLVTEESDKNNRGNFMSDIFASDGNRYSSSSNTRSFVTSRVVGDVNDLGYDFNTRRVSAGSLPRPVASDGVLSYRLSSSRGSIESDSSLQPPMLLPGVHVNALPCPVAATGKVSDVLAVPPDAAVVTTGAAAMPPPLPSATPITAKPTVPAVPGAKDADAELDAFLAASFDFFADSEQLDHRYSGQWLPGTGVGMGVGNRGPVAPFLGAAPPPVNAIQGLSFDVGGIGAHPGQGFTSSIRVSFPGSGGRSGGGSSIGRGSGGDGSSSSIASSNALGGISRDHGNNLGQSMPWFGSSLEVVNEGN